LGENFYSVPVRFVGVPNAMPVRLPLVALLLACVGLAAGLPRSVGAADITPAQRQAIEGIIHDYLVQNPDVLIEALRKAEEKMSHDAEDKASRALVDRQQEIFDDPATPVGGNPKGDVAIVEFFDYRCPYCKQVQPAIQSLLDQDRNLRFVYKELPVLGPQSVVAAHAALAARQQGKYEAFHSAMMATKGQIGDDTVYRVAGSVGLDVDRLKQDMATPEIVQAVKANLALANALDIHGTPAFIVGDHIVPGAIDLDALKDLVADARKR
jgi:protein-disulfide isomerase